MNKVNNLFSKTTSKNQRQFIKFSHNEKEIITPFVTAVIDCDKLYVSMRLHCEIKSLYEVKNHSSFYQWDFSDVNEIEFESVGNSKIRHVSLHEVELNGDIVSESNFTERKNIVWSQRERWFRLNDKQINHIDDIAIIIN
jgi:hypothetical protein